MKAIEAEALTTFEPAPDGGRIGFHAADATSAAARPRAYMWAVGHPKK